MKARIKFTKTGPIKYIGHLDTMRYFQKALRRAAIPVTLSEGFSPHMLMSFASPLGVGKTSSGEYFDVDLKEEMTSREIVDRLNAQMVEGVEVLSAVKIGEKKADKGMTLVAGADYTVTIRADKLPSVMNLADDILQEKIRSFLEQPEIRILRKTKRKEEETDIRPWIYEFSYEGENRYHCLLSAGSVQNLKPDLVIKAFALYLGGDIEPADLLIHRNDIFADTGEDGKRNLVPLDALGEVIE